MIGGGSRRRFKLANTPAVLALDRMLIAFALILTGLALPAIDRVEADIRAVLAE